MQINILLIFWANRWFHVDFYSSIMCTCRFTRNYNYFKRGDVLCHYILYMCLNILFNFFFTELSNRLHQNIHICLFIRYIFFKLLLCKNMLIFECLKTRHSWRHVQYCHVFCSGGFDDVSCIITLMIFKNTLLNSEPCGDFWKIFENGWIINIDQYV